MNVEILGWIATMLLLVGYYLNAKQLRVSWLIWMVGNAIMALYAYLIDSTSVTFLSAVLIGLNVYGYSKWSQNK
jgi:hypothetical protein